MDAKKIVNQCVENGNGVDEALWELRRSGAHPAAAAKAIRLGFALTLGDATAMLMRHQAWSDVARLSAPLQDALIDVLDEHASESEK